MTETRDLALSRYDDLLAEVGRRAPDGERVVEHWPHVGAGYDGLVVLGQAVYGWSEDFEARTFVDPEVRREALDAITARNTDRPEPMDWIATHRVRRSPFWTVARLVADQLAPGTTPWFSRFAWANLYPVAPELGNPSGWLREAQDAHVGPLVQALMEAIDAKIVVALVGPYWWPTGSSPGFESLEVRPRPLARSGIIHGRIWIVGWHPGGASRRGYPPAAYSPIITEEARRLLAIRR